MARAGDELVHESIVSKVKIVGCAFETQEQGLCKVLKFGDGFQVPWILVPVPFDHTAPEFWTEPSGCISVG